MDPYQTILRLRSIRQFLDRPLPEESLSRILEAGRWCGSAKNSQPWRFVVVRDRDTLIQLSACGRYASHLKGAAANVVIVTQPGRSGIFDAGRAAQNMMLAAWAEGIGSCIATFHDESCARAILGIPAGWEIQTSISFGYPDRSAPPTIEGQPRERILAMLGRKPLDELVRWEKW